DVDDLGIAGTKAPQCVAHSAGIAFLLEDLLPVVISRPPAAAGVVPAGDPGSGSGSRLRPRPPARGQGHGLHLGLGTDGAIADERNPAAAGAVGRVQARF